MFTDWAPSLECDQHNISSSVIEVAKLTFSRMDQVNGTGAYHLQLSITGNHAILHVAKPVCLQLTSAMMKYLYDTHKSYFRQTFVLVLEYLRGGDGLAAANDVGGGLRIK